MLSTHEPLSSISTVEKKRGSEGGGKSEKGVGDGSKEKRGKEIKKQKKEEGKEEEEWRISGN